MYVYILIAIAIGYVLGSIPFALVIGKVFYNTDVREHGSGNLGGSNAGRILGKKVGISVMVLDLLKVVVAIFITSKLPYSEMTSIWAGVAAAFGHCYPLFAQFKGGKAVATMFGFLFGISIFSFNNLWMFVVPFSVFLLMIICTKIVSFSSIIAAVTSTIFIAFNTSATSTVVASTILTILVIYRHRANIDRMMKGEETKVTFLDRKKK